MNRTFDLMWLVLREFFKHPAEDIRQANPIVPGRVYRNFGYVCKAVPYSSREQSIIISSRENLPDDLRKMAEKWQDIPNHCLLCDFQKQGIPCPLYNQLKNGQTVCDTHKYVILQKPKK